MLAKSVAAKAKVKPKYAPRNDNGGNLSPKTPELPPFAKWLKSPTSEDSVEYKVGDTKEFKRKTWYYCDAPDHHRMIKWYTHPIGAATTANIAPISDITDDVACAAARTVSTDSESSANSNVTF